MVTDKNQRPLISVRMQLSSRLHLLLVLKQAFDHVLILFKQATSYVVDSMYVIYLFIY